MTHFKASKEAKEMFNRHHFFSTNKQYVNIKLLQNETNLWSSFLAKKKYWQNFDLKALIITTFTFLTTNNFKTDRYLNNFQEHLFGILRMRKYQMLL